MNKTVSTDKSKKITFPAESRSENSLPVSESEKTELLRIIDANANRAAEGLRVIEDFARFALDDRFLTQQCKDLRHDLTAALAPIASDFRFAARQTEQDVGTQIETQQEYCRKSARDVFLASANRLQQALRCLEEYSKVLQTGVAEAIEPLRYRAYTLQQALAVTNASCQRLDGASLYVLIDGGLAQSEMMDCAQQVIDAGAHMIQLRDKMLDDRQLLDRARQIKSVTRGSNTLFIMNDRPDIAVLAHADGVHVGQDELSIKDVRCVVGPQMLIGLSTHSIDQARQAVLAGANYIGVGPTFPSATKNFNEFPGVALLRQVADEIQLPAFAIGGICAANISEVLETGIKRIAVGSAITKADQPAEATRQLLELLQ